MTSSIAPCSHPVAGMYLKYFWQVEGAPAFRTESILPSGEIELIFSFADRIDFERRGLGGGRTHRCFVNGMSNIPVHLSLPQKQCFFGVVLQPAAVKKLLTAPAGAFLNAVTDLELVDTAFSPLWHQLAECKSFEERTAIAEAWALRKRISLHTQELAISQFLTGPGEAESVRGLAATFCYSTRQLHRKVQEIFGMSSEVLLRYKRYCQALHRVHHSNELLTSIAHDCGYYDQAHFNREFREFTGLTPSEYRRQKSHLQGHLFQ